jgi:glycosyltransferase involved in cell wall biosynthesis
MKKEKILKNKSVWIISIYKNDQLKHVQEMFESIFAQSMKDFDVYVQEDGTLPQELHKYLEQLLSKDKIQYLGIREENKGLAFALNELVQKALANNYTYLVRMDADDINIENRFEQQYNFMEANAEIDVVGSWIEEFSANAKNIVEYQENSQDIVKSFRKRCPIAHVTSFFRSSFFEKAGLYRIDNVRNEDQSLWIDGFYKGCKAHNFQEVLVRVRADEDYMTRRSDFNHAFDILKLKLEATIKLKYGLIGAFYAFALFGVMICPPFIKNILYKYCR